MSTPLTPQSPFTNQAPYYPYGGQVFNTTNYVQKLTVALTGGDRVNFLDRRPFGVRRRGPGYDKRGGFK